MINKNIKKKNFDRAASTYDEYAVLQNEIINNLIERLELLKINPKIGLELGCGTGHAGKLLQKKFNKLSLINYDISEVMIEFAKKKHSSNIMSFLSNKRNFYICGDIDFLPFEKESFDFIWTSSALQWSSNLESSITQIQSLLKPGGLFIFSTFGPGTLKELGAITQKIFSETTLNYFYDLHDIGDMLLNKGYKDPVLDIENFVLTYEDPKNLLIDLRKIGATAGPLKKTNRFLGKSFLDMYFLEYGKYKQNNLYPASYEVIYGHAWKSNLSENLKPIQFK